MPNILDRIVLARKKRIAEAKKSMPLVKLKQEVANLNTRFDYPFEQALKQTGISIIAEVKKASPSKGVIDETFDYIDIAKDYEEMGAQAISILTEPDYFLGNNQVFMDIRQVVKLPLLRKDFIVDEYMIYEAKLMGADAILLIVSILDYHSLQQYINLAHNLGMSCLVEAHDVLEIEQAKAAGARVIGVNNRNLKTFQVDFTNAMKLKERVSDALFVAESGVQTRADIESLEQAHVDAALIGEVLMKAENRKQTFEELRGHL
ncbi:indole-3-glycerol phosphate synthase [Erysipelotrichaceae bacterium MTC7]|nr:indole-3-glycerol phosphate synthase [Erysipelotrichaceae bacterium MTC7]